MSFIIKSLSGILGPKVQISPSLNQVRNYAARKGTREKARKNKVKVEVKKAEFIPHNQRGLEKMLLSRPIRKFDDSWKQIPEDNVYPTKYYRWKVYPFHEAVQCYRETHHPTMYNVPDALLKVVIELNMEAEKKNRYLDNFNRMALITHPFEHGEERNIIVFTKDEDLQNEIKKTGVTVGGTEIIRQVQSGDINLKDFQYIMAHPNILPELVTLRGLMKRKFPNPKNGTLSNNLLEMVHKYLHGINYSGLKDDYEKDFGIIETTIGPISMKTEQLEENFESLLKDLIEVKAKNKANFIRRCLLVCPPSPEKLKVDHNVYLGNVEKEDEQENIAVKL